MHTTTTQEISEQKQVLLVEDSLLSQRITGSILKDICKVTCVEDSAKGLEAVTSKAFDLVIADLMLKEGTSLNLIRQIRKISNPTQLPIIVVSSGLDQRTLNRLLLSGVNDAYEKPISPKTLKSVVIKMLEASYARKPVKGSLIPVECFYWESNNQFFSFNPDTTQIISGSTKEEATQKMIKFLQENFTVAPGIGMVNETEKIELSVVLALAD